MKSLIQWHKEIIERVATRFGLSQYQLYWIAAIKGIVFGYLVGVYL